VNKLISVLQSAHEDRSRPQQESKEAMAASAEPGVFQHGPVPINIATTFYNFDDFDEDFSE
jgi:hypothetical protein